MKVPSNPLNFLLFSSLSLFWSRYWVCNFTNIITRISKLCFLYIFLSIHLLNPQAWMISIYFCCAKHHQFSSVTQSCPTLRDPMNPSTPGLPVHHQLPEFTQTHAMESVMPSSHLILCLPLILLPPIPPSFRVFSNESTLLMRWPKYWSFSFSIIPSKEIPGLISFKMDWLDLLEFQGTLKSLLQHHSSKPLIFQRSAFFTVQLSRPYMTTEKP